MAVPRPAQKPRPTQSARQAAQKPRAPRTTARQASNVPRVPMSAISYGVVW